MDTPRAATTTLEEGGTNAVGRMLGLLGDEWLLLLVNQALMGARRRQEFGQGIPVSGFALGSRLARLEAEGMLVRVNRTTYEPTDKLISLWAMLMAIWSWERTWNPGHDASLDVVDHSTCGQPLVPAIVCRECGERVVRDSVDVAFGPSGAWSRSVPEGSSRRRWRGPRTTTEVGRFAEPMTLFGNRWSASLLGAAFMGITRFADFEVALGAPPVVVSAQLRQFVGMGVMTQHESDDHRAEYELTDKGWAFHTVVVLAIAWAQRWYLSPEGPAVVLTHTGCGAPFRPRVVCTECDEVVTPQDVVVHQRRA